MKKKTKIMYILYNGHFAVQQKLTQHGEPTILQLKKNKKKQKKKPKLFHREKRKRNKAKKPQQNQVTYIKELGMDEAMDFSSATRSQWNNTFRILKENCFSA